MDDKLRAAYALNLCTVSVAQILDYNDINVLEQEYENILNNLNLEQMPKAEPLLDIRRNILDTITFFRMSEGDKKMIDLEYQHKVRNAVWSAIPSVGAIFATSNPVALGITLATQVGIGYMNYRRNRAEYQLGLDKEYWQLRRTAIDQLNGLQKELFTTAWKLSQEYNFPDEYRLTEKQIHEYNKILMEGNPIKRYNLLAAIQEQFTAYPQFWYQIGSTANSVFRSGKYADDIQSQEVWKSRAMECFEKYRELNQINVHRTDIITSSWALEYLELQNLNENNKPTEAKELIEIAKKYSGDASDVLELCAFAYLRISDYDSAAKIFQHLVDKNYNLSVNLQILSMLYIKAMHSDNPEIANKAKFNYNLLKDINSKEYSKFILSAPNEQADLSHWEPEWNRDEVIERQIREEIEKQKQEKQQREEAKRKAVIFYKVPIKVVYTKGLEDVSEYFLGVLNENRNKVDSRLPAPCQCEIKEYLKNRGEFECMGAHIIMIGDSSEAKKLYKNAKKGRWDYYKLGMRYITYGNKTVLLTRKLKNEQIDELIGLANEIKEKHPIKIPSGVESVQYTFFKELFEGQFDTPLDIVTGALATIITAPLLAVGQQLEFISNSIQGIKNKTAEKKLEFLQYCIAIYHYLNSENAIID